MSGDPGVLGWFSRRAFPRLAALVVLGAVVAIVGTVLLLVGSGDGGRAMLGFRLALVGYLVFLFGASGYLAFSLFERSQG